MDKEAVRELYPPQRLYSKDWDHIYISEAVAESFEALLDDDNGLSHNLASGGVENLIFIDRSQFNCIENIDIPTSAGLRFLSNDANVGEGDRWGKEDMMIDLGSLTREERVICFRDAASFSGGSVYLLDLLLRREEASEWLEALSLAADRDACPKSLLISKCGFDIHGLLNALKNCRILKHLSLQDCPMDDDCIHMLAALSSLTRLSLLNVNVSAEFLPKFAGLRPWHSPLAASLQVLDLYTDSSGALICANLLQHWPQLKELTLNDTSMNENDLMECIKHLVQPRKPKASSTRLYSLTLGRLPRDDFPPSLTITAAVVDALYASRLPFFKLEDWYGRDIPLDPAIKSQLLRNQLLFRFGLPEQPAPIQLLERVPATSIRLFICGDPYAGKTTLVSTMHSIYSRKRDKLRTWITPRHGPNRTQGIEVRAIKKDGIRVSLWDMAGQQEFHAFHDCMLPDIGANSLYQVPCIFMFIWNPKHIHLSSSNSGRADTAKTAQEFEESFRYWLKFLASKRRQSNATLKVVVVFTWADQMDFISYALSTTITSLRSQFKEIIEIVDPTFEVDARKKDGRVKAVVDCIFEISKEMLKGVYVYGICMQVSKHLSKHLKKSRQQIITWSQFRDICKDQLCIPDNEAIMKAIALTLNDYGIIVFINGIAHIVLDPDWFCNKIMGSLIHFPGCTESRTIPIHGYVNRHLLVKNLESITKCGVESLLVHLMEAMHLCCKVPSNLDATKNNNDELFIPATLGNHKEEYATMYEGPRWRASTTCTTWLDDNTNYTYMGRRLECANKNLTFLTPGLFPRIQVLFHNAFKYHNNADVKLGKDFISICLPNKEIIIVFCQAKSEHVIDVLVRAPKNNQQDVSRTLAYVEKQIINNLITICAQPIGIQGVKLIESIIRPDSLQDPSRAEYREDQCLEMIYLKQELRKQLEQGEPLCHVWKGTRYMNVSITDSLIDLVSFENYLEVLKSYEAWLNEVDYALLDSDEVNGNKQHQIHQNVTVPSLEDSLDLDSEKVQEGQISEQRVEVESSKEMAMAILRLDQLHDKMDVLQEKMDEMTKNVDRIYKELKSMREDVVCKVEKALGKLLKLAMENEVQNQLPRVVILTSDGVNMIRKLVTSLSGDRVLSVRIELYCEDQTSLHPVENQEGITLTCLSESLSQSLGKALPYVNGLLCVLITAAKFGINSVIPPLGSTIPDLIPYLKVAKGYPMISETLRSKVHLSGTSSISHVSPTTLDSFQEWQRCLASILTDNGGVTDENIANKFRLRRGMYRKADGSDHVAWLCDKHYKHYRPCPLG